MALAPDGTAKGQASSALTVAAALTTGGAGDIIVAFVQITDSTVTPTILDVAGLTWNLRGIYREATNTNHLIAEWWAYSAAKLTADLITVSFVGSLNNLSLSAVAVKGSPRIATPFDDNPALPYFGTAGSSNLGEVDVSTWDTNDMVLSAIGTQDSPTLTPNLNSLTVGTPPPSFAVQYEVYATVQDATPQTVGISTHTGYLAFGDALYGGPPGPALAATVSASPVTGASPLAVDFTGGASGGFPPYSWAWTFGDGNTSTEPDPSDTYVEPGPFLAQLVVTDAQSNTATASVLIFPDCLPAVSNAVAGFAAGSPLALFAGIVPVGGILVVFAIGNYSSPPLTPGPVVHDDYGHLYHVGPGFATAVPEGGGTATQGTWFYTAPLGTEANPTVTITDAVAGAVAGAVFVLAAPNAQVAVDPTSEKSKIGGALGTGLSLTGTQASDAEMILFAGALLGFYPVPGPPGPSRLPSAFALSSPATQVDYEESDQTPTLWWAEAVGWQPGGAVAADGYTVADTYTATYGTPFLAALGIYASGALPLVVAANLSPTGGPPPLTVTGNATISGGAQAYTILWDMGDGTTYDTPSVTETYSVAGVYTVTLTVTDALGDTFTEKWTVVVGSTGEVMWKAHIRPTKGLHANSYHGATGTG